MFTNSELFSFEEGVAKNNNVEIYYRDYGPLDGDPILLVQGLGGQLINWPEHLIEFLIDNNFRPIVFDNRDAGLSDNFDDKGRPPFIWNYIKFDILLLLMKHADIFWCFPCFKIFCNMLVCS